MAARSKKSPKPNTARCAAKRAVASFVRPNEEGLLRDATNANSVLILNAIARIARLQQAADVTEGGGDGIGDPVWHEFERSLTEVFGQRLFTVLAYDATSSRL